MYYVFEYNLLQAITINRSHPRARLLLFQFMQCHVYVTPMIRVNKQVIPSQGSGTHDFRC